MYCFSPALAVFLSTLSLRRATANLARIAAADRNFYPRSPCGERLVVLQMVRNTRKFLSTLSLRRATKYHTADRVKAYISIHALLAESDSRLNYSDFSRLHFYPRSPCGERPANIREGVTVLGVFLSTLSLRRATNGHETSPYRAWISIHALLAESDLD